jgi:hypothetical protein
MGARRHDGAGNWRSPAPFAANLSDVGNRSACDAIESGRLAAARSACASECGLPLGRPLVKSGRLSASSAPVSNHRVILIMMMSRHGHLACDAIVSGRLHASEVWAASRQPPL